MASSIARFAPKDVYPLIACVLAGCSFAVYKGTEHLLLNPDVQIDRTKRTAVAWEKYDPEEGAAWRERTMHHYRHKDDELRNLSIFEPLKASWWSHRAAVHADPASTTKGGAATFN